MRLRGPASAVAVGCVLAIACSAVPVRRVSTTRVMPATDLSIEEPIRLKQPLAVVWNRREDTDYLGRIGPRTLRNRRVVVVAGNASLSWIRIFDPVSGELLHDDVLRGMPFRAERTHEGVAFLTQQESREGVPLPVTLAVADDTGRVRTVRLERIKAGSYMPGGGGVVRSLEPALIR